ncbi:hypothetical protein Leryth_017769, partial [Lithospermum erythrorhizon]
IFLLNQAFGLEQSLRNILFTPNGRGCCWAFSVVAAVEGINQLTTGILVSLSEQELVDCDISGRNEGCNGGFVDDAFNFIINNGLPTESSYPYKGFNGTCSNKEGLRVIAMYPSYPTAAIIN